MKLYMRNIFVILLVSSIIPLSAQAQDTLNARPLSLDEAVRIASNQSENIRIAREGIRKAQGQVRQARSQFLPQLYGSAGYTRTLKSQYEGLGSTSSDTTEDNPFSNLSSVGFGAEHQYQLGLSFSQSLFSGGRIIAVNSIANAGKRSAQIELDAQSAQLILDITQAYYDASLADRLLAIAEASYDQTQAVFKQVELNKNVGTVSEFELLRAQVTRDNQLPVVIQRRSDREVAYLRLKQMLNLPLEQSIKLSTAIEDTTAVPPGVRMVSTASADTSSTNRATVQQAAEGVRIQQGLLRVARAQRLPSLSLTSQYGRVAFPQSGIPGWSDFRQNWTVGLGAQVPFFTGGRIRGDVMIAQADLNQAKERFQQTKEYAALDARVALNAYTQAEASYKASAGTTQQAERAYSIALVRYKEGISTHLELNDARLLLDQARANHALSARNLQIARVKLALLPSLPLSTTGQGTSMSNQQQLQPLQQLPSQSPLQSSQQPQAGAFSGASTAAGAQPQSQ